MDDADAEAEHAQGNSASAQGTTTASTVEDVQKQMADLGTQDLASKGG
jgi:hypothetical protein